MANTPPAARNPASATNAPPGSGNPFWTFSLSLYSSQEVQAACLTLQDGSGVDVNVMLYLMWLAAHGQSLTDTDVRDVVALVEPWKAGVVVPLRTARRNLKQPPERFLAEASEALRTIVKKAELEAERLQQTTLYSFRQVAGRVETGVAIDAAGTNLDGYGRALARELADAPRGVMLAALRTLLDKG